MLLALDLRVHTRRHATVSRSKPSAQASLGLEPAEEGRLVGSAMSGGRLPAVPPPTHQARACCSHRQKGARGARPQGQR